MKQIIYFLLAMLIFAGITSCEQKAFRAPEEPIRDSLDVYVKQAEQGDVVAQYYAGTLLLDENTKEDSTRAIGFLKKAANAGYPMAQTILGNYYNCDSTEQRYNIQKAVELYRKAADNGFYAAMQNLGNLYARGEDVKQDYGKAMDLFKQSIMTLQKLSSEGDVQSMYCLAQCLEAGDGIPKCEPQAAELYKKAANLGYWGAQWALATYYLTGKGGLEKDEKAAFKWMEKAAQDEKHPKALAALAGYYRNGFGVEQDMEKAFELSLKAAEKGSMSAQYVVAYSYIVGAGVAQDYSEAFKWYMKLAEKNDVSAQNNIGAMFQNGEGVTQNYKEAFKWFMKAAKGGNALAQANVGRMLLQGFGTEKDEVEAVKWLTKSAMQDNAVGQQLLAYCYANGIGVPRDKVKAAYWADIANKR